MKNLFVGNLSFQTTEDDLRSLFEPFGQINRVHIATDRDTGRSRGFALVDMANDAEATRGMTELNGKEVGGRPLKVNEARPKADRGPRTGGFGRGRGNQGFDSGYRDFPMGKREPRW